MRLRTLSEAECYTRCYGGRRGERISVIRIIAAAERPGEPERRRPTHRHEEKAA